MDTIEIRPMNTSISSSPTAAFAQPGTQNRSRCCREDEDETRSRNGHVRFRNCEEVKETELASIEPEHSGKVLLVDMTLRNVCPCRRVAVGYHVSELDASGNEHSRGFKTLTVPPHYNSRATDVQVPRVRFLLPDDEDTEEGCQSDGTRRFIVRSEAHYADSSVSMP
ncbi:MAG: hypothetical protein Q4G52_08550 [Clostridia bacterium]|nr:hypothetical protein [Clostridia bacterium]